MKDWKPTQADRDEAIFSMARDCEDPTLTPEERFADHMANLAWLPPEELEGYRNRLAAEYEVQLPDREQVSSADDPGQSDF